MLQRGDDPQLQAALVKDLGALFEQEIPDIARRLVMEEPALQSTRAFCAVLAYYVLNVPAFFAPRRHAGDPSRNHSARTRVTLTQQPDDLHDAARALSK